jgi:hypothetical protein
LRPYLTALPDFENIEAEDRSRSHALAFPDALTALHFFLDWPDLASAAALFKNRIDALDGNHYQILTPAVEALRDRQPLASVLLWRAMINEALHKGRATRYGCAANHLADCALADAQTADYGDLPTHES